MNVLVLVIWCCLLLSCAVSLPRRRQVKYPVTKPQNSHCERSHPTALEVLERTLLHPKDKRRIDSRTESKSKLRARHSGFGSTSPLYPNIDGCVASFGDESQLCKPKRRQKKSFIGIPDIHKRRFRSNVGARKNMTLTSSTLDDFFGVFKSSTNEFRSTSQNIKTEQSISKFNTSPGMSSYIIPSNIEVINATQTLQATSKEATTQSLMLQTDASTRTSLQQTTANLVVKSSLPNSVHVALNNDLNKMILPGSVQKIESKPELLYLEGGDNLEDNQATAEQEETQTISSPEGESMASEETSEATTEAQTTTPLTVPTLKSSFLTGSTYSKTNCESETKKSCICSFTSVDSDFKTIFSKAKFQEDVMAEIANMKCRLYTPKPPVLNLNTNSKPRVLKGKHHPFAVDNRQGAKEVTEKSLDEFIAYSAVDDGITRVFVSSDVKIPCFPRPDIHLSATDADHVKYIWTFGNKKEAITQGRITEDTDGDGSLTIQDIELTDSMNYTCEIDYIHPDTGERTTDTFVHSLSVVTLPTVSARAMVHYKSTATCDESLLEMLEMYLPQQVEAVLCSPGADRPQLCSVVIHSPVCHDHAQGKSKREISEDPPYLYREKREGAMEMSLNYDVFIHRPGAKELPGANAKLCDPDCHLLINFKLLQFFKESVQEVALMPIISKVQDGGTFTPVPSSVKVKYIFGCIGGYYLDNGFCLACPRGMYSDDGATECQPCPVHTYSGTLGTRRCTPCKYLWMPVCNEAFESVNILMIVYVVAGVALLLAGFLIYYVFWYKGQTWKEVIKKGPKEKMAKSERVRSKKESKRIREEREAEAKRAAKQSSKQKAKQAKEELQQLLQSSGESGAESEASEDKLKEKHIDIDSSVSTSVSSIKTKKVAEPKKVVGLAGKSKK